MYRADVLPPLLAMSKHRGCGRWNMALQKVVDDGIAMSREADAIRHEPLSGAHAPHQAPRSRTFVGSKPWNTLIHGRLISGAEELILQAGPGFRAGYVDLGHLRILRTDAWEKTREPDPLPGSSGSFSGQPVLEDYRNQLGPMAVSDARLGKRRHPYRLLTMKPSCNDDWEGHMDTDAAFLAYCR